MNFLSLRSKWIRMLISLLSAHLNSVPNQTHLTFYELIVVLNIFIVYNSMITHKFIIEVD